MLHRLCRKLMESCKHSPESDFQPRVKTLGIEAAPARRRAAEWLHNQKHVIYKI